MSAIIEKEQLEVLEKYLKEKGILFSKKVHEPNGRAIFPDFRLIDAQGRIIYVEMTSVYLDLIKDEKRFEASRYGYESKSFFDSLENEIKIWLPQDYSLIIDISGPIIKEKGRSKLAKQMSLYFKNAFEEGRLVLEEKDFIEFIDELQIMKACFLKKDQVPKKIAIPLSTVKIPLPDFSERALVCFWRTQMSCPELGLELKKLIEKKTKKVEKGVLEGKINDSTEIWLVIKGKDGFDVPAFHVAFNKLLTERFGFNAQFKKIFIIVTEMKGEIVYEVKTRIKNNKQVIYLESEAYWSTENMRNF